jgi:hypothetical protein
MTVPLLTGGAMPHDITLQLGLPLHIPVASQVRVPELSENPVLQAYVATPPKLLLVTDWVAPLLSAGGVPQETMLQLGSAPLQLPLAMQLLAAGPLRV